MRPEPLLPALATPALATALCLVWLLAAGSASAAEATAETASATTVSAGEKNAVVEESAAAGENNPAKETSRAAGQPSAADTTAAANAAVDNRIILRADQASLNQQAGTGVYEGNAELVQGLRRVNADRIEITLVDGKPSLVEATGSPVIMRDGEDLYAEALTVIYDISNQRIRLLEQARIDHQGRQFEGAELEYELDTRRISARGTQGTLQGDGDGRIRLVIPAEDTEQQTKEPTP